MGMNLQGETYSEELAEGAEPQDLCEAADKEVARLTASLEAAERERDDWKQRAEKAEAALKVAVEALEEIKKGRGPFDRDPLLHCGNTVDAMKQEAAEALTRITALRTLEGRVEKPSGEPQG